jgi:hypothetical protein
LSFEETRPCFGEQAASSFACLSLEQNELVWIWKLTKQAHGEVLKNAIPAISKTNGNRSNSG